MKQASQPKTRKQSWFAPRQIYLRTGHESSYVELSTSLQVSVAVGFCFVALWLLAASYSAVLHALDGQTSVTITEDLQMSRAELMAMVETAARVETLELALDEANEAISAAKQVDETAALRAELSQTRSQLDNVRRQLSKAKADEATLEARLEAQASRGASGTTPLAEEAVSLHKQLEEAYAEIEDLQQSRDESEARAAALAATVNERQDETKHQDDVLATAHAEIERLQAELVNSGRLEAAQTASFEQQIEALTSNLNDERSANEVLRRDIGNLSSTLEDKERVARQLIEETAAKEALQQTVEALSAELAMSRENVTRNDIMSTEANAAFHAQAIDAELREAELLATVEQLRREIQPNANREAGENTEELKARLAVAEAEIERMVRNTLARSNGSAAETNLQDISAAIVPTSLDEVQEITRLKTELATAQSDIIKLKSDVRAAKRRLVEQTASGTGPVAKADNTAKLQQQLASTRSRMQQLNKALADAKLREVAVDLALINVVPSPSPRAPR